MYINKHTSSVDCTQNGLYNLKQYLFIDFIDFIHIMVYNAHNYLK